MSSGVKQRPLICLIDQDPAVRNGWLASLRDDADLHYFRDHLGLLRQQRAMSAGGAVTYSCVIMCRYYSHLSLDIVKSPVPLALRAAGFSPLFLNDQGYVGRDELERCFDGKIYHRYGVRWQTLKVRIQKVGGPVDPARGAGRESTRGFNAAGRAGRPGRCSALLREMAKNASGSHQEKIRFYADQDPSQGILLLEALYARLMTEAKPREDCPSRYINSSPVIARRVLYETLYTS
ncbi:MAG: hypothetical protein H6618_09260 [Deltaproteobacteria bacterium]|nr:hypothetical protein [Deltaproteobacteria bacterium]